MDFSENWDYYNLFKTRPDFNEKEAITKMLKYFNPLALTLWRSRDAIVPNGNCMQRSPLPRDKNALNLMLLEKKVCLPNKVKDKV